MPKVSYNANQGLIQQSGTGFDLNGSKNSNILVRSATTAHDLSSQSEDITVVYTGTMDGVVTLPNATAANAGMVIKLLHAVDSSNTERKVGVKNQSPQTTISGTITLVSTDATAQHDSEALLNNAECILRDANAVNRAGGGQGTSYTFTYLGLQKIHCKAIGVVNGSQTPNLAAGASSATGI